MASTLAAANQRYFDSIATSYDTKPWFTKTNQQVTEAIRSRLDWIGIPFANTDASNDAKEVRLLDYACGTGLMTRTLGPYVTKTLGIDISTQMVSTFNSRVKDAGLSHETVHAIHGNLLDKNDPNPSLFNSEEWKNFDIATVGFGFHHFEDVVFAASQLKARLRPGGVLVINDFLEGGDVKADEEGKAIEGSEGNWAVAGHGRPGEHGHDHSHDHDHAHNHHAHHAHHAHAPTTDSNTDSDSTTDVFNTPEFKQKMRASIVVPHFTIEGVKKFFTEAGFVDVDVVPLEEKSYMEFGGQKLWRTILIARGRVPLGGEGVGEKSEL